MPNVKVFKDGDQWCALVGEDLQEGIAGFGPNPSLALLGLLFDFEGDELPQDRWPRLNAFLGGPEVAVKDGVPPKTKAPHDNGALGDAGKDPE